MFDPDDITQRPEFKAHIRQLLSTGEVVEGVYNCPVCEDGSMFILPYVAIRDFVCPQCGYKEITKSFVTF